MSLDNGLDIARQHDLTIFAGIPSMPVAFLELHFEIRIEDVTIIKINRQMSMYGRPSMIRHTTTH